MCYSTFALSMNGAECERSRLSQAAKRKLALTTTWRTAGRSSEAVTLTIDQLEWEDEFGAAYAEVAQTKVSKMKLIALVAGRHRHCCWLLDFADYLTIVERENYDPEQPAWIFPELARVKQGGTKSAISRALGASTFCGEDREPRV